MVLAIVAGAARRRMLQWAALLVAVITLAGIGSAVTIASAWAGSNTSNSGSVIRL